MDTTSATYDLSMLTDTEFTMLVKAYEHYMNYIQHCPPKEDDSMWAKMQKLVNDRVTVV